MIMPEWLFWTIVWWGVWFAMFLTWMQRNGRKARPIEVFFMLLMAGFTPLIAVWVIIKEAIRKTK